MLVCLIGLVFVAGLFAANHHFFRRLFEPDTQLEAEEVPEAIRQAFEARFPGVQGVQWELEDGEYEVASYCDGLLQEASFSEEGEWIQTADLRQLGQVPEMVRQGILTSAGTTFRVGDIMYVKHADGTETWEVELKNKFEAWDYLLDSDGKVLDKEEESLWDPN